MLTRQVKNVLIKANKQKDINELFETKSRSKIFSMSHQKKILWIYDINGKNIIWLHKGHCIEKWIGKACAWRKKRNKLFYKERIFLRTFWWNYKWIRMMSFYHSQLQLIHSCITTSRGLSQMARKKRMFFKTFFTWNNTFFATLASQATKGRAHGLFFNVQAQLYVHVYFKWASSLQPL